jgi:hypothetical protein
MGLPTSRDITISPGDPIPGSIINKLEDQVTGHKRPNLWMWQALQRGLFETNITFDPSVGFGGDVAHANANAALLTQGVLGIEVGDRITDIGITLKGTGAAQTCDLYLMRADGVGGHTPVEHLVITDPAGVWATYTKALVTPEIVVAPYAYYFVINLGLANTYIGPVGRAKDRL